MMDTWQMAFNVKKCGILSITNKKNRLTHDYLMKGETLARVPQHEYLGVTIADNLKWTPQVNKVASKASRTLGLIRRNLHCCSTKVKKSAYETLVRPKLEYATTAWSPHTTKAKQRLESVQRSAARFVLGDYRRRSSVTQMLNDIGWDSLDTL